MAYSDPSYNVIQNLTEGETNAASAWSVGGSGSHYASSGRNAYFRCRDRAVVLGVTVIGASGGSVGGTVTLKIARKVAGGSESLQTGLSITASKTSSFLGKITDFQCSANPVTVESFGDIVYLTAESSTLSDKCANLTNIVWRYRLLPLTSADVSHDKQQQ